MPVNYQNGKIYTIVNDVNDTIYVGSTTQVYLSTRMSSCGTEFPAVYFLSLP